MRVITIGRQSDNMVVVNDFTVGRRHAQIIQHDDGHISIVDLSSKNGTFINGKRISDEAPLVPGDKVKVGMADLAWEGYLTQEPAPEKKKKKSMLILSSVIAGLLCTAALCLVLIYTSRPKQGNNDIAEKEEVYDDKELSADSIAYYENLFNKSLADADKANADARKSVDQSEKAKAEAERKAKEAADAKAAAERAKAEAQDALLAAQNAQNDAEKAKAKLEYEKARIEAERKAREAEEARKEAERKAWEAKRARWREWNNTLAAGYIKIDKLYLYATTSYAYVTAPQAREIQADCKIGGIRGWRFPSALEINTIKDELIKYRREIREGYGDGTYDAILYQNISDIIDNYTPHNGEKFWTKEKDHGAWRRRVVFVRDMY